MARSAGAEEVPYLVDACQAVGQLPIESQAIGCDYLAGTARKFLRGPRGIGFLYVSDRALAAGAYPLLVDMHGATWTDPDRFELTPDARRFESWEISSALVLGLGAAARYALDVGRRDRPGPGPGPGCLRPRAAGRGAGSAGARSRARSSAPSSRSSRPAAGRGDQAGAPGARDQHQRTGPHGRRDRHGRERSPLGDPDFAALLQHGGGDRYGGRRVGGAAPTASGNRALTPSL